MPQLLVKLLKLLAIALIVSSCLSGPGSEDAAVGLSGDPTKLTITPGEFELTLLNPQAGATSLAGVATLSGECGKPGYPVVLSGAVSLFSTCENNYTWAAPINVSALSTGDFTVNIELRNFDLTAGSPVVSRTFSKLSSECSDANALKELFANYKTNGNGTSVPYVICSASQFKNIRLFPSSKFVLGDNIDFYDSLIDPIAIAFTGELDGRGHTIRGFKINKPTGVGVGLFSAVQGASIRDLRIEEASVKGYERVGLLAGQWREGGTIQNVFVAGKAEGVLYTAGLIGLGNSNSALNIDGLTTSLTVTGNNYTGGVIGYVNTNTGSFTLKNAEVHAKVTGLSWVGGVSGRMFEDNVTLENVDHIGNVTAQGTYVGGLFGELTAGSFLNVRNFGRVETSKDATQVFVGGLVGQIKTTSNVDNAHVVGEVLSGGEFTGGLFGAFHSGAISNASSSGTLTVNDDYYNSPQKFSGGLVGGVISNTSLTDVVSSMTINSLGYYVGGLVGHFAGVNSSITRGRNLGAINARVSHIGGLVGNFEGASITDSFNKGNISVTAPTPRSYIGGIAGYWKNPSANLAKTFSNSVIAITNGTADYVGGIAGYLWVADASHIYSAGQISGMRNTAGGLVGFQVGNLHHAYSSATLQAGIRYQGGAVGYLFQGSVTDVATYGSVQGSGETGGVIGQVDAGATTVARLFSTASVRRVSGDMSMFGQVVGGTIGGNVQNSLYALSNSQVRNLSDLSLVTGANSVATQLTDVDAATELPYVGFTFSSSPLSWTIPSTSVTLLGSIITDKNVPTFATLVNSGLGIDPNLSHSAPTAPDDLYALYHLDQGLSDAEIRAQLDSVFDTSPVTSVTPGQYQISVLSPATDGVKVSTRIVLLGECGVPGAPVVISGDYAINSICQTTNRWAALLDLSGIGAGNITLDVELKQPNFSTGSPKVTRVLSKTETICSDSDRLADTFANYSIGGNGTTVPYKICNTSQFQNIAAYPSAKYQLADNIYFGGDSIVSVPLFTGEIDGQGFAVKNYRVSKVSSTAVGLFDVIQNASFKNIGFTGFDIEGYQRVGGVAGQSIGSVTLENVHVEGTVRGIFQTGGMIGVVSSPVSFLASGLSGSVAVTGNNATGGFFGQLSTASSDISLSSSTISAQIVGLAGVGGVAGIFEAEDSTVDGIAVSGSILALKDSLGGVFGRFKRGSISNSTTSASLTSSLAAKDAFVGGIAGHITGAATLSALTSTGNISAKGNLVGGIAGQIKSGTLSNLSSSGSLSVIDDVYNSGLIYVGGLFGLITEDSSLSDSSSSMTVDSRARNVGGLVGYFDGENSSASNVHASGAVTGRTSFVGGAFGMFQGLTLSNSSAIGSVSIIKPTPKCYIGGLMGYANSWTSDFSDLFATGSISASDGLCDYAGGLIGYFRGGALTRSYAHGNISGVRNFAGGLIGLNRGDLTDSFATGTVNASTRFIGGLIGYQYLGSVTQSFSTGDAIGADTVGGLIGEINGGAADSIQLSYAYGRAVRVTGSSGDPLKFGGVYGVTSDAAIVASSTYRRQVSSVIEQGGGDLVGHAVNGVGIVSFNNPGNFSGYDFAGIDSWRMPPAGYQLPNSTKTHLYPALAWMGDFDSIPTFEIAGNLNNLRHGSIQLKLNNAEVITVSNNGADQSFVFSTRLQDGQTYDVSVQTQPSAPSINCSVSNASGTVSGPVSDIIVSCPSAVSLAVSAPGGTSISVGEQRALTSTVTFSDSTTADVSSLSTWTTDNAASSSVNSTGVVTGIAAGVANIQASYQSLSNSLPITTASAQLIGLEVSPSGSLSLQSGNSQQLSVTAIYDTGATADVTSDVVYNSSSTAVADFDGVTKGLVNALSVGTTTLTMSYDGVSTNSNLSVTEAPLNSITVLPANGSGPAGSSIQFDAIGLYADGSSKNITSQVAWSSDNLTIMSVSDGAGSKGLATLNNAGSATVSATFSGVTGTTSFNVTAATLASISIQASSFSMPRRASQQLVAMGTYTNGTIVDVTNSATWSSSNINAAQVVSFAGQKGILNTGVIAGSTSVSVSLSGKTAQVVFDVTSADLDTLVVTPNSPLLPVGVNAQFKHIGTYTDGSVLDLTKFSTWTSSDNSNLVIANDYANKGSATNLFNGSVRTTVSISSDYRGAITQNQVQLAPITPVSLFFAYSTSTLAIDDSYDFDVYALYSDGTTALASDLSTWSSLDPSLCSVSDLDGFKGRTLGLTSGTCRVQVQYNALSTILNITIGGNSSVVASGTGLRGEYYPDNTMAPAQLVFTKNDALIDVNFESGTKPTNTTGIAVRWVGRVKAPASGSFTFKTTSRKGMRMWLGQDLIINDWSSHNSTKTATSSPVTLVAGNFYDVKVEMWGEYSRALGKLEWTYGSTTQVIPTSALFPPAGTGSGTIALESLSIDPASILTQTGVSQQIRVFGHYSDGTVSDLSELAQWSSGDDSIVVIDNDLEKGMAQFIAVGETTISATYNGITADIVATIQDALYNSIALQVETLAVPQGFKALIRAIATDGDGVEWDVTSQTTITSSDDLIGSIVELNSKKYFKANSIGTATVSAVLGALSTTSDIDATSAQVVSISLNGNGSILNKDTSYRFRAIASFDDSTQLDISEESAWSSSLSSSVSVSNSSGSKGLAQVLHTGGNGTLVTITASAQSIQGQSQVRVINSSISQIFLSKVDFSLQSGDTTAFKVFAKTTDNGVYDVTSDASFTFTDSAVADVLFDGTEALVRAKSDGLCTITAQLGAFSAQSTINVSSSSSDWTDVGTGLLAEYYSGNSFGTYMGSRIESGINKVWVSTSDLNAVGEGNNFSIRYSGTVVPEVSGNYTFTTYSDKRIRVWVNGSLVIDAWSNHNERYDTSSSISLNAGQAYSIQVDYARTNGDAAAQLYWTPPAQSQGLIPARVLFPE